MYRERVDAYIESKKEEMLSDLMTLVKINSQKGPAESGKPFGAAPAAALETAGKMMEKYGLSVKNYENYVVTGDFSDQDKKLDILAHLDVVSVTEDWTVTAPFEPKIVDNRIYGRGTADDKGPAIAALYALRAIKELQIPLKNSVRLILGADEECGSSDLAYYYGIEKEAPYSFTPDADFPVINVEKGRLEGEFHAEFKDGLQMPAILSLISGDKANVVPQRSRLVTAGVELHTLQTIAAQVAAELGVTCAIYDAPEAADEKERELFTQLRQARVPVLAAEIRGKSAHASTPEEGKNALTAALRLASKLPLANSMQTDALGGLDRLIPYEDTCGKNLGIYREDAEAGALTLCFSILRVTPENLTGTFDARLPMGCTQENTFEPVKKALAECGIQMPEKQVVKPHCVPGNSPFVRLLLDSYERYTGIKGEPLSTGGGTYVHNLERGVAFGCMTPDVDNHMHGDDEFMEIDTLLMSAKIFADVIIRICNEL